MSIEKLLIAVESSTDDPAEGMADAVTRRLLERAQRAPSEVVGLTVDTVTEPLTGTPRMLAIVQLWAESERLDSATAFAAELTDLPSTDTSTWTSSELVFREPTDRQSRVDAHHRVKLIGSAFRRDDFTVDAFFDYWRETHAPISGSVPGGQGYVVSRVHAATGRRGDDGVDGFIELWWPDRATFDAAGATEQQARAWEDVGNYAKTTGEFWITHEHVVVPPPPTGPGTLEA